MKLCIEHLSKKYGELQVLPGSVPDAGAGCLLLPDVALRLRKNNLSSDPHGA